jgi:hypothetical protein
LYETFDNSKRGGGSTHHAPARAREERGARGAASKTPAEKKHQHKSSVARMRACARACVVKGGGKGMHGVPVGEQIDLLCPKKETNTRPGL